MKLKEAWDKYWTEPPSPDGRSFSQRYGDWELTPPQPEQPTEEEIIYGSARACGKTDSLRRKIEQPKPEPEPDKYKCEKCGVSCRRVWKEPEGKGGDWLCEKCTSWGKPEQEAWAELRAYLGKPPFGDKTVLTSVEYAWPEISRRVQKMIGAAVYDEIWVEGLIQKAIKAERERLVRALRKNTHWALREMADKLEGES